MKFMGIHPLLSEASGTLQLRQFLARWVSGQEHAGSQAKSRHLPLGELELIHVVGNAISEKLSSLGL
jgi:hypothetical protein